MDSREKQRTVILDKFVLSILKIVASGRYNNFSEAVSAIIEKRLEILILSDMLKMHLVMRIG
ncbi:hypothetical protein [Methanobrevibacter sp.]|uniref:hypothetical protein n=1 Tax=Methanobrevibacter sp. TaxID=66852 RepID=UPI0026DFEC54|nr:hypothetical protein [Methanobrevibacter sp.]